MQDWILHEHSSEPDEKPNRGNAMIKSYRDLKIWNQSMDLAVDCYHLTRGFPRSEQYGLSNQLKRTAVSIPSNIAEGNERQHTKEFIQHLSIAYASLAELETQLELARRLGYLENKSLNKYLTRTNEIGKMINGLRRSLKKTDL